MKKTAIILLTFSVIMIAGFYSLNRIIIEKQANKSTYDEIIETLILENQVLNELLVEMVTEKQDSDKIIERLKLQFYKNPSYEIFYGEWEVSDNIYVDPMPIRGIYLSEDELADKKVSILKGINLKTIQFTDNNITINENNVLQDVKYNFRLFPANDDFNIYSEMTLKDIGLTEDEGNYFVFVEADIASDNSFGNINFFIKDVNTLVVYKGHYCIEYIRTSYEGGTKEPVIIVG